MSKMGEEFNRRLEAHAQDLYEACKAGAMWIHEGEDTSIEGIMAILKYMNKAIAKVEGKNG